MPEISPRDRLVSSVAFGVMFGLVVFGVALWRSDLSLVEAAGIGFLATLATGVNWWFIVPHHARQDR